MTDTRNHRKVRTGVVVSNANDKTIVVMTVRIMETRPLSKMKRWRLVEIIERAK